MMISDDSPLPPPLPQPISSESSVKVEGVTSIFRNFENIEKMREKAEQINLILLGPDVNLWKLRELAISEFGLVNDQIRRRAWPKLVGLPYQRTKKGNVDEKSDNKKNDTLRKQDAGQDVLDERFETEQSTYLPPSLVAGTDLSSQSSSNNNNNTANSNTNKRTKSLDYEQIERDVARCTWHLLTGSQRLRQRQLNRLQQHKSKKFIQLLRRKQKRLGELINLTLLASYQQSCQKLDTDNYKILTDYMVNHNYEMLSGDDKLRYYQGYHDVATIFLVTLGGGGGSSKKKSKDGNSAGDNHSSIMTVEEIAAQRGLDLPLRVLRQVSFSHFREPMRFDFHLLQITLRLVLLPLIKHFDNVVHEHLMACQMEPFFAISWVITWFSHDIRDTALVKRLFDFFIVSHPLMPIYLSVAMILHKVNRMEILSTDCFDFAEVHQTLTNLPKNSSMVGWKWRLGVSGGGYVSDEEDGGGDGDESTAITMDDASYTNNSYTNNSYTNANDYRQQQQQQQQCDFDDESETASLMSGSIVSLAPAARVPFQELIELAISLMSRVPPKNLISLAAKYYGKEMAEPLVSKAPEISMLKGPPTWSLTSTATADWVIKQRARELAGMQGIHRRDRRNIIQIKKKKKALQTKALANGTTRTIEEEKVKPDVRSLSFAAIGLAPGEETEGDKKRRKMLVLGGAAFVAIAAIALILAAQYTNSNGRAIPASPESSSCTADGSTQAPHETLTATAHMSNSYNSQSPAVAPASSHQSSNSRPSSKNKKGIGSLKTAGTKPHQPRHDMLSDLDMENSTIPSAILKTNPKRTRSPIAEFLYRRVNHFWDAIGNNDDGVNRHKYNFTDSSVGKSFKHNIVKTKIIIGKTIRKISHPLQVHGVDKFNNFFQPLRNRLVLINGDKNSHQIKITGLMHQLISDSAAVTKTNIIALSKGVTSRFTKTSQKALSSLPKDLMSQDHLIFLKNEIIKKSYNNAKTMIKSHISISEIRNELTSNDASAVFI